MRTRRSALGTLAPLTLAMLLALGAAGCGGGSSGKRAATPSTGVGTPPPSADAGTHPPTDPTTANPASSESSSGAGACTLVTEPDATTALGSPAGAGVLKTTAHATQCVYGDGAIIVTVADEGGKTAYDQGRAAIAAAPAGTWADVSDLGDAAFTSHGGPVVSVEFYKGPRLVSIIMSGSTTSVPTDAAVTLAKSAAARV